MGIAIHNWSELDDGARDALLQRPAVARDDSIRREAEAIVERVRRQGDDALRELTH